MKNKTEKFKQLEEKMKEAKAAMIADAQVIFNDVVKELFEEFPELESFSWPQYTPYFNDGDECIFGVCGDDPTINGIAGEDIHEEWSYRDWNKKETTDLASNPELVPVKKAVSEFLFAVPEDMMKFVFGDHIQVTINRDGTIEKDDYEHD